MQKFAWDQQVAQGKVESRSTIPHTLAGNEALSKALLRWNMIVNNPLLRPYIFGVGGTLRFPEFFDESHRGPGRSVHFVRDIANACCKGCSQGGRFGGGWLHLGQCSGNKLQKSQAREFSQRYLQILWSVVIGWVVCPKKGLFYKYPMAGPLSVGCCLGAHHLVSMVAISVAKQYYVLSSCFKSRVKGSRAQPQ